MSEPDTFLNQAARWGVGALAVGGSARLLKHVLDISRDRDLRTRVSGKTLRSPITQVPVEVSPEEAGQLTSQGVQVPGYEAPLPAAQPIPKVADLAPNEQGSGFTGPFYRDAALGLTALGGLAGGWSLADKAVRGERVARSKALLARAQQRVNGLLDENPEPQDAKLAGVLAAGEEAHMAKRADVMDVVNAGLNHLTPGLGYVAGPAAALGVYGAYQRARDQSKSESKLRQIQQAYEQGQQVETPYLTLQPVLRKPHGLAPQDTRDSQVA